MPVVIDCPPVSGLSDIPSVQARLLLWLFRNVVKPRMQQRIDLAQARRLVARLDRWLGGRRTDYARTPVEFDGLHADWVTVRPGRSERVILYLPGGGFMFQMPAVHARLAARLCRTLDAAALIPHYRCAPEHPLPAAHDDCHAAYAWLLAEGYDPARIVIAGDSAGGLLALSTLQRVRDKGMPPPLCGVMFSPGTCFETLRGLDPETVERDPMIGAGIVELLMRVVIDPLTISDDTISPCAGSLHGLPPLLFQAGSTEALLPHSTKAHALATAAGTTTELQIWPQMPHVWQAVAWLPEARHALACVADFVRRHERRRPPRDDVQIRVGATPAAPHGLWLLDKALSAQAAMPGPGAGRLKALVARNGGDSVMAIRLARRMRRDDHILVLDGCPGTVASTPDRTSEYIVHRQEAAK